MAIKGYVYIQKPELGDSAVEGRCTVIYKPFQVDTTDIPIQLGLNDSVGSEIDKYQQKAMDFINAEASARNVPNPILNINEIRVYSTISK